MPPSGRKRNQSGLKERGYSGRRSRSVPHKRRFVVAILLSLFFDLAVIALITSAVAFFFAPAEFKKISAEILIACLAFSLVAWLETHVVDNVERAWQVVDNRVQQRLDTFVLER